MLKVSIVLPSLNVAAYIRECIESVINQTLRDIEILCIDAGSTDGTCEIIQEYAANCKPFLHFSIQIIGHFQITSPFFFLILFLYHREKLYTKSENIIKDYIDGNYTVHLPQSNEGTIYQLLSSVDQLATMLQAKNDTEQKTKEFLKNTISDISHQLKTPLSALMMYQEIIEHEPENSETVKEFSLKIGTAIKRMEQLIQSMLKITRIDAGSLSFEKSNYSISNIINHAISELTTRADNEKKEIVIDGDLEQMLYCDIEWTGEAIGNIIKNALDHTDAGGKITISWKPTPAMIRIFITDNGHGISQEDIHHIFKRFYRSKNTSENQGIGLGLPLAKAIVEGQGGILSVQSERLQGTTFTLSFLTES